MSVAHATRKRLRSDNSMRRLIMAAFVRRSLYFCAAPKHFLAHEWISKIRGELNPLRILWDSVTGHLAHGTTKDFQLGKMSTHLHCIVGRGLAEGQEAEACGRQVRGGGAR